MLNKITQSQNCITIDEIGISVPNPPNFGEFFFLGGIKSYKYFLNYVESKTVLDIGCGYGYGSYLMSWKAKQAIGIDLSKKVVETASNLYQKDNLEFLLIDAFNLKHKFPTAYFDVIIAREFIEHIKEPLEFLQIAHYLLSDEGMLILTTPNRLARGVDGKPWNPEHIREFDEISLRELLLQRFSDVRIIGMSGSEKVTAYDKIRTGGDTSPVFKKLWRYIPEIMKKPVRKLIVGKLPQDITMDDFYFEDKVTSQSLSLVAFCKKLRV
ncbi:MAG: class I SAM-dependent methyltransferase [Candidatus Stahlbacteria bacterium]|nr:class I SAM-dependent methyltransferase [Candidatus Stahlbacteria bacterium]